MADTPLITLIKNDNNVEALALIRTGNSNPEFVNASGNTALIMACQYVLTDVALELIGNSNTEQVNNEGNTALIYACNNWMDDVAMALIQTHHSKPEQVNHDGNTALILACNNGLSNVALALIRTGNSTPAQINANGDTALILAEIGTTQEVVDLLLQIPEVAAQRVAPPVQRVARAFEIHNFFNLLNIDNIEHFLTRFNNSKPEFINPNVISLDPLFNPLITFVKNTYPENKKQEKIDGLKSINSSIASYGNYDRLLPLLKKVVTFVSKQSDAFITQYIDILKYDCLNAYNSGARSICVKGMVERTVTVLKEVAIVLLTDEPNNEFYIQLKGLFIDFNELIKEWAETYLDNGPKASELNKETAKAHFIAFMEQKYGASISDSIREKINAEARNIEEAGIFENLRMGGGRKGNKQKTIKKGNKQKTIKKGNKQKTIKKKGMRKKTRTTRKNNMKKHF